MKREVKAGLFVAAVVCGLAAIFLGGGVFTQSAPPDRALQIDEDAAGGVAFPDVDGPAADVAEEFGDDASIATDDDSDSVAGDISEDIAPPPEDDHDAASSPPPAEEGDDVYADDTTADAPPDADIDVAADTEVPADGADADEGADANLGTTDHATNEAEYEEPAVDVDGPTAGVDAFAEDGGADAGDAAAGGFVPPTLALDNRPRPPVAPPANLVAAPRPARHRYVVREGESYWTISKKLFGKGEFYDDILRANPDRNPMTLREGTVIAIPDLPGAPVRREHLATNEDLRPSRKVPRVYLAADAVHVVQPGETLGEIAKQHYDSALKWPHILLANRGINPRRLRENTRLVVPALTERPGAPRVPEEVIKEAGRSPARRRTPRVYLARATTHVIQPGETLQHVSKRHYGVWSKYDHIVEANPGLDPKRLKPYAEIVVPALTE